MLRPQSTGHVTIASGNVWENAIIEPKYALPYPLPIQAFTDYLASYFSTPNDIKTLIQGIRLALRIAHTEPLRSKLMFKPNTDESSVFFMGDADPETITDSQIEAWLRKEVETIYHPVSSSFISLLNLPLTFGDICRSGLPEWVLPKPTAS